MNMATMRKRGTKWQAVVRRTGNKPQSKCFIKKSDALIWAREIEGKIDCAVTPLDMASLSKVTFKDLMVRYEAEVSPAKKSASSDHYTFNIFKSFAFVNKTLNNIRSRDFVTFRDTRLSDVAPSTVRRNLALARHVYEVACKEWDYPIPTNPLTGPVALKWRELCSVI